MKRRSFIGGAIAAAVTVIGGKKIVGATPKPEPQKEPENPNKLPVVQFSENGTEVTNIAEIVKRAKYQKGAWSEREKDGIGCICKVWVKKKDAIFCSWEFSGGVGKYWGELRLDYGSNLRGVSSNGHKLIEVPWGTVFFDETSETYAVEVTRQIDYRFRADKLT